MEFENIPPSIRTSQVRFYSDSCELILIYPIGYTFRFRRSNNRTYLSILVFVHTYLHGFQVEGRAQSPDSQTRTRGFGELQVRYDLVAFESILTLEMVKDLDRDIRRRAVLARYSPIALVYTVKKKAKLGLKRAKRLLQKIAGLDGRV